MYQKMLDTLTKVATMHGSISEPDGWAGVRVLEKTEDTPTYFQICMILRPGKKSYIRTEICLPTKDNWNGCFLGLGVGGIGGYLNHAQIEGYVKQGYAVGQSDLGTSLGRFTGESSRDTWIDFGHRANHVMTLAGKALLYALYGEHETYAYFFGASTGGQQGLSIAQHYPTDYNGIVSGVPAHNRVALHTYFLWNYLHLISPKGRPLFSPAKIEEVAKTVVAFYQERGDGEPGDWFVSYPKADKGTINACLSYLKAHIKLSKAQETSLYHLYHGPHNSRTGKRIYGGLPMGSELNFCGLCLGKTGVDSFLYPFKWAFGKDYDGKDFDFDRDFTAICRRLSRHLDATNPDLSAFYEAGGKLLSYSGTQDSCVPYHESVRYLGQVVRRFGQETANSFFRYFLLPGKGHSVEGSGVQSWRGYMSGDVNTRQLGDLELLRLWVEEGKAPDSMTAICLRDGEILFERVIPFYQCK